MIFGDKRDDVPVALSLAEDGTLVVCGSTRSKKFPLTEGSWQEELDQGKFGGFVAKFDPDFQMLWATYVAGGKQD